MRDGIVKGAAVSLEDLEHEIATLAAGAGGWMARWLELVAEFDRRGGARRRGFRGTAEWLAWRCGIGSRAAREHVRVARRLPGLPHVRAAFAGGELSYSKVRALTRASDVESEEQLLQVARESTADRLEQFVRSLRSAPSADVDVANRAHDRRYLEWWLEGDGSLRICGRLPAECGAAFVEAIETAVEALHGMPAGGEPRERAPVPPMGARRADALAEIMVSGAPRAQVVLHVDSAALACAGDDDQRAGEICALEDGPAVPSETARRLACDSDLVVAARGEDGGLDQGRKRRVVSPALRTSLERRDRRCRFPACARRHGLHAHHIEHWAHGGRTDRDNLTLLCRFHHRMVHEGGFTGRRDREAIVFRRPDGVRVPELPPPTSHPPPLALAA